MNIGILGGTFDPVHHAHLAMARAALEQLATERIVFLPTGTTRYRDPAVASGEHRVAMLRLVLADDDSFEIDTRELAPGASGYTVDTLKELRLEYGPDAALWLLMGADQYAKFESWHRPGEIRRLSKIAVFARPGAPAEAAAVRKIEMEPMNISSSDIRERVARGDDIAALVPPPVAAYIAQHGLYR